MKLAFFAGKCLPIQANSLEERPLGGTETALIYLSQLLAERGHSVSVFSTHSNPQSGANPQYLKVSQLTSAETYDAFVSIKDWNPLFYPIKAKRKFFWTGDAYDQFVNFGLGDARVVLKTDGFLAVSEWQGRSMCQASGFPLQRAFVVRNGIELSHFEGTEERVRKRLLYSSAPYRGLALVPKLFQEVRASHPDAELHIFSGLSIYDTEKKFEGPEAKQFEVLKNELSTIPGCTIHGNIKQKELAREMMKSSVFFYPCTFPETSCISAMEAQAAGCVVVTSAIAGLPETVGDSGFLVTGTPGSPPYMSDFVKVTNELLSNDVLWDSLSKQAKAKAFREFSWKLVADRFEQLMRELEATID